LLLEGVIARPPLALILPGLFDGGPSTTSGANGLLCAAGSVCMACFSTLSVAEEEEEEDEAAAASKWALPTVSTAASPAAHNDDVVSGILVGAGCNLA